ncbi:MAG: hypothetical protein MRJ67_11270 [Nitrospirales bacterium]|nr:hypothetical protein [Nitrospirales bacterium]
MKVRGNTQDKGTLPIRLGQRLEVEIPSDAIYLVAPELSPPKGLWTNWKGRIVLAPEPENNSCIFSMTIMKVRSEQLTLHSQQTLGARNAPSLVGDRVVLLIDPRAVGI